jgi:type IV pilus assembly protein PilW
MLQNLRAGMDVFLRDIRMAGFNPKGTAQAGFVSASVGSVQFTADRNANGYEFNNTTGVADASSGTDPSEKIRYALTNDSSDHNGVADGFPCSLGRESWSGGLQQLAENIQVLNFVYLDANQAVIAVDGSGNVSTADLPNIRTIEITLVARADRAEKDYTNNTQYRNQQNTVIFTAPGDGYRHRLLTATVHCRNMGL